MEEQQQDDQDDETRKKVLLDYFTGVRCVNCPQAIKRAEELRSNNNDDLIIVAYHVGSFAEPHDDSEYDFRNQTSENLFDLLGRGGIPAGSIDRRETDDGDKVVQHGEWAHLIQQSLDQSPAVSIALEGSFNDDEGNIEVNIEYLENIDEPHNLTVLLTENNLVDWQLGEDGWIEDYEHNHAIRKFVTSYNGASLDAPAEQGQELTENFNISTADYIENPENANWIVFVHHSGSERTVIQTEKKPLKE